MTVLSMIRMKLNKMIVTKKDWECKVMERYNIYDDMLRLDDNLYLLDVEPTDHIEVIFKKENCEWKCIIKRGDQEKELVTMYLKDISYGEFVRRCLARVRYYFWTYCDMLKRMGA